MDLQVTKAFKNQIPNAFLLGLEDWFGEGRRKLQGGMCDIPSLCTNTSAGIERKEEI